MTLTTVCESVVDDFKHRIGVLVKERFKALKKIGPIIGKPTFHREDRSVVSKLAKAAKHPNDWMPHSAPPHVKASHRIRRLVYQANKQKRNVFESSNPSTAPLGSSPVHGVQEPNDHFKSIGGPYAPAYQARSELRKFAAKIGVAHQVGTSKDARAVHGLHQRIAAIRSSPSSSIGMPKTHAIKSEVGTFLTRWNAKRAGKNPTRIAAGQKAWNTRSKIADSEVPNERLILESLVDEAKKKIAGNLCVNVGQGSGGGFSSCSGAGSSEIHGFDHLQVQDVLRNSNGRAGASPEAIARYSELSKAYSSWRRKYSSLKKREVELSNIDFYQKKAQSEVGSLIVDPASALGSKGDLGSGDLCKQIPNLCAGNHGIRRADMPQVPKEKNTDFQKYLSDQGVTLSADTMAVGKLRATQSELNAEKVTGIAARVKAGGDKTPSRIIISADNFVFDGHHRWAAYRLLSPRNTMPVWRASVGIDALLKLAHEFPGVEKRGISEHLRSIRLSLIEASKKKLAGNLCVNVGQGSGGGFTACNVGGPAIPRKGVVPGGFPDRVRNAIKKNGKLAVYSMLSPIAHGAFEEAYRTLAEKNGGTAPFGIDEAKQRFASAYVKGLKHRLGFDETRSVVETKLHAISGAKEVFGRTKTAESIATKSFIKGRSPADLTDIAGTTLVVGTLDQERNAVTAIQKAFKPWGSDKWGGKNFEDYLTEPKEGYRAVHFLADVNGKPVEIQLKTAAQVQWSVVSHLTVYNKHDNPLKRDATFKDYLMQMSEWMADVDAGKPVPPKPPCRPPKAVELSLCL